MIGIIVNIVSFILAVYLSIGDRPKKVKAIIWTITIFITIGNIYVLMNEQRQQKPYVDALIPHISSLEAFDLVKRSVGDDLKDYDLIDVVGSSYICLNKPELIFHRFPEWLFVFRNRVDNQLLEFKVSDSRLPDPPLIKASELDRVNEGQIAYYIVSKKGFYDFYRTRVAPDSDINYALDILDQEGKTLIILHGRGPIDDINEVEDGINSQVLARVQAIGRPTDRVTEYKVIEDMNKKRTIFIKNAKFVANQFHASLASIKNWKIDAEKAIEIAVKKGAKGAAPGKELVGGHPIVRLYNGVIRNLQGSYWKIPYRIDIRPLLVDASTSQLYAVNNEGNYSTKWEKSFEGISQEKVLGAAKDKVDEASHGGEITAEKEKPEDKLTIQYKYEDHPLIASSAYAFLESNGAERRLVAEGKFIRYISEKQHIEIEETHFRKDVSIMYKGRLILHLRGEVVESIHMEGVKKYDIFKSWGVQR